MADIFVSYAAEDGGVARYVAEGLEKAGYTVWYYQKHGQVPGEDYLGNIGERVREARAVVLFVSDGALSSAQCESEAQIAWEERKELIPLLSGFSFEVLRGKEVKGKKEGKRWADRIGTRVSIQIDAEDPEGVLQAVLAGVRSTVRPSRSVPTNPDARPVAAPVSAAPPVSSSPTRDSPAGAAVATVVGGLGVLYCLFSLGRTLSPPPGPEAAVLALFPTVKTMNVLVNVLGLLQNAGLVYGAWLLRRRDSSGAPLIRKIALSMLAAVGIWTIVCVSTFSGASAAAKVPDPVARSAMVSGTITLALMALVPSGIVFWMFRGARK
jgi:hypothetical protein